MRTRAAGLMQRIDAVLYKAVGLGASLVYSCQAHRRPSVHQRRRFRVVCLGLALASVVGMWAFWSRLVPSSKILPELAGVEDCVYSEHDAGFGILGDRRESSNSSGYVYSRRAHDGSSGGSNGRSEGGGSKSSLAAEAEVTIVTFHAGWREVQRSRWSLGAILDNAFGRCGRDAGMDGRDSSGSNRANEGVSTIVDEKGSGSSGRGGCSKVERVPKPPGYHNWRGALHAMGYHPTNVVVLGDAFVWKLDDEASNWRGRVNAYRTFAQQHARQHGPRALLVFTDAYDALALRGPAALVSSWYSAQRLAAVASSHRRNHGSRQHGSSPLHSSHLTGKGHNANAGSATPEAAPTAAGTTATDFALPRVLFGAERLCDTLSCRADPSARARMASMQASRGSQRGLRGDKYHAIHRYNNTTTERSSGRLSHFRDSKDSSSMSSSSSADGAATGDSPAGLRQKEGNRKVRKSPRHYLNAGFFMGEASAVVGVLSHAFNYMATHPSADDQAAFVDFWLYHNTNAAAATAAANAENNVHAAVPELGATFSEEIETHSTGKKSSPNVPMRKEAGAVLALDYWGLLVATLSPSAQHNAHDWSLQTAHVDGSSDAPLIESVRPTPSLLSAGKVTLQGADESGRGGADNDDVGGAIVSPVMVHFASLKPRAPPPFTASSSPALIAAWLAALRPYDDDGTSASGSGSAANSVSSSSTARALTTRSTGGSNAVTAAAAAASVPYSACEEHLAQIYNLLGHALQQRAAAALRRRQQKEAAAVPSPLQPPQVQPPMHTAAVDAPAEPLIGACSGGSIGGIGGGTFKFIPLRGVFGTKPLRRSSPAASTTSSISGGGSAGTIPSFTSPCNRWAPEPALRALQPGTFLAAGGYLVARGPFKSAEASRARRSPHQEGAKLRGTGTRIAGIGLFETTAADDGLDDDNDNDVEDDDIGGKHHINDRGGAPGGGSSGSNHRSSGSAARCRWVPLWYQPFEVPPRHLWPSPHHLLLAKLSKPDLKNNGALALEVTISRPLNAGQFDTWRTLWRSRISRRRSRQRLSASSSGSGLSGQAHLGIDAVAGSLTLVEGAPPPPWTTGADDDDDVSGNDASGGASSAVGTAAALWSAELRANPGRLIWATPAPQHIVHSSSRRSSSSSNSRGSNRGSSGRRLSAVIGSDSIGSSQIELVLWAEGALELRVRRCPAPTLIAAAGSDLDDVGSNSLATAATELVYVGDQDRSGLTFVDGLAFLGCVALVASVVFLVTRRWSSVAERRREGLWRRQQQQQEKHLGITRASTTAASSIVKGLDKDAAAFAAYVESTVDHCDDELYGRM